MLIFLDLETSGLLYKTHQILEVGIVLASDELEPIDQENWVIHQDVRWERVTSFVKAMHTTNGLWDEVEASSVSQFAAQEDIAQWLEARVPAKDDWIMAGNSIHFDRSFIRRHMPRLESAFHYRMVDVSSFKEMVKRWAPAAYYNRKEQRSTHRAVPDCLGSIEELKYYREILIGPRRTDSAV